MLILRQETHPTSARAQTTSHTTAIAFQAHPQKFQSQDSQQTERPLGLFHAEESGGGALGSVFWRGGGFLG